MSEHSDLIGGSSAGRRIHCTGSYRLEQQVPKPPTSEAADRGTALHMAMEDYLLNHDGEPPEVLLGNEYAGEKYSFVIDKELLETKIKPALTAFNEIIDAAGGTMDYMIEVKVSLDSLMPGVFGRSDILGIGADGRLWKIDWKFGDGVPVSPKENFQNAFYAAAALHDKDAEIRRLVGDVTDIVFVIVQPRVGYDEPVWQMWETTTDWVNKFVKIMVNAYNEMLTPNAPLTLGVHCRWCRAKKICPLQQNQALTAIDAVEPMNMDTVTLADWLDKADQLTEFIKAIQSHAHTEIEKRGVKVPGWKLVGKRPSRVYNDEKKSKGVLLRQLGEKGAYQPRKLLSPSQAQKALGKPKYDKMLAKHVSMVSSGTTLARSTDKRPDVGSKAPLETLGDALKQSLVKQ